MRATAEEIVDAYKNTGSVWAAGKRLGMAGQSVHERLVAIGYPLANRKWDGAESEELRALMLEGLALGEIAKRLGRTYAGVTCKASELEIPNSRPRDRRIPRGKGYTKPKALQHMTSLETSSQMVTQYARREGLDVEMLVQILQRHCPERWTTYVETHSSLPKKTCPYCAAEFVPNSGKQRFCTRKCQKDSRVDLAYFGNKRRTTVGLAAQTCQLCGRKDMKGLSSHHVLGKENDPDNEFLIALCPGCHQVVTILAGRAFVNDRVTWESLIALVWSRAHGAEIGGGSLTGKQIYTEVILEVWDDPDEMPA